MAISRSQLRKNNEIQSFIIFDTEATGLECPKFTEICMLGVLRAEVLAGGTTPPRVSNKITLCLNPEKEITQQAQGLTGLTNGKLGGQQPFNDDVVKTIESFLRRHPPPVCLVSHNGDRFDFAVLNSELQQVAKTLPGDLLCADTFQACKGINIVSRGQSLALDKLHRHLLGEPPRDSHSAEGDCIALLKVILHKPEAFVQWMDKHSKPLKHIPLRY